MARGRKSPPPPALAWRSSVQLFVAATREDGQRLVCDVLTVAASDQWAVMAIETPSPTMAGALDDHRHKALGTYPALREAMDAAESFVHAWLHDHKATRARACSCDEITASEPSSARASTP
jgi:hypothetical protein